ncbi:hypothetical protein EON65_21665 [archaeon]|nr:MAG: hypothetical protein EON65_21665 [archaeon]
MNSEIIDAKEKSASNDEQKISHRRNAITSESTDLNALSSSLFYTALHSELIDLAGQSKEIETNKAYIRSSLQFPSKSPIPGSLEVSDGKKDSDEHYHNSQRSSHHHKSHHHGHHHKHRTPKRSRKEIVVNVKEMIAKAKETVPKPMPGKTPTIMISLLTCF